MIKNDVKPQDSLADRQRRIGNGRKEISAQHIVFHVFHLTCKCQARSKINCKVYSLVKKTNVKLFLQVMSYFVEKWFDLVNAEIKIIVQKLFAQLGLGIFKAIFAWLERASTGKNTKKNQRKLHVDFSFLVEN